MPTQTPSDSFGFLIADVSRLLRRRFDEKAKGTGLTRAQWHLLARLSRNEGINQVGLADLLDMEPMSVCRLVDRMEESGWVRREADPDDRRARRLWLTDKTRRRLAGMQELAGEVFDEAFEGLAPGERRALLDQLARIRSNLSSKSTETLEHTT